MSQLSATGSEQLNCLEVHRIQDRTSAGLHFDGSEKFALLAQNLLQKVTFLIHDS